MPLRSYDNVTRVYCRRYPPMPAAPQFARDRAGPGPAMLKGQGAKDRNPARLVGTTKRGEPIYARSGDIRSGLNPPKPQGKANTADRWECDLWVGGRKAKGKEFIQRLRTDNDVTIKREKKWDKGSATPTKGSRLLYEEMEVEKFDRRTSCVVDTVKGDILMDCRSSGESPAR